MKSLRLLPWCRKLALMETNYAEEEFLIQQGTNRLIGQTNPQNMGKELYSFRWPFDSLGLISNISYVGICATEDSSAKRILKKKIFSSNRVSHEHHFVGASIKEFQTNPCFVWGPRSPRKHVWRIWDNIKLPTSELATSSQSWGWQFWVCPLLRIANPNYTQEFWL